MNGKKREELFSPEFDKVLEAIDNWKAVNNEGKSFIASFVEEDEEGYAIRDTALLAFGYRGNCIFYLGQIKKALDEAKVEDGNDFINW